MSMVVHWYGIPAVPSAILDHRRSPQRPGRLTLGEEENDGEQSGDEDTDGTEAEEPQSPLARALDALN
ncbi:MAG: hypothetical protein Q9210_006587 [Variospora velana]